MAAKGKNLRLEIEIEKYRSDGNWSKVLDLSRQISTKSPQLETLVKFVEAEAKLERFLLENLPDESNITKAQQGLVTVNRQLQEIVNSDPKVELKQEALMLLGKIQYSIGNYPGSLIRFDEIDLDSITINNITNRKLRIIGESFAIKGLCLDRISLLPSSKFKQAEREAQIIACFERAGDICLLQLQEKQEQGTKGSTAVALQTGGVWNLLDADTTRVGPFVEAAVQRSPVLYIRNGQLSKGIGRFRELLQAVETRSVQSLRQTLARQLAEVLLRGVCHMTYDPVTPGSPTTSVANKPRKYSGKGLFVPNDEYEESLLLLLISESIATREVVLNKSPELSEARQHTFDNTTAVYDLLTIALVRRAQYPLLTETFERAMKFSFDEFHVWYQFALSLICAEKYSRALLVLKECLRLEPTNGLVPLLAAKLCFEHLHKVEEGLHFVKNALETNSSTPMAAKAYLILGVGYNQKADEASLQSTRQDYKRKALEAFQRAATLDINDHLAEYHVALQLAHLRQISQSMHHVQKALRLRSDHTHSLHLLALLLSANKQYTKALQLIKATVADHPDNFNLLFTKAKLEEFVYGAEESLQTYRDMLRLWKNVFEPTVLNEHKGTGLIDRITMSDHRSLVQLQLTELSDRDSSSIRAESIAASRLEQTLSEVASSLGSSLQPKQEPHQVWALQNQIWLQIAELYLGEDKLESAHACIQEAANINSISHMVSYMRGRLHEQKRQLYDAKLCYENATSINAGYTKSLQHLGIVLHKLGNQRMAEKVLRDAVNVDPTSSQSWHNLGTVLEGLGDYESATECLVTAVELEASSPVLPFSVLPRPLQ